MLKVTYRLRLGQDEFELQAEVKDEKELFETLSFYSSLPKTAPKGANDLKITFRTTKKGHKYYSLVSESEKKEFKFGQNLEANGGGLFPKGWSDLYEGEDRDDAPQTQQAPLNFGQPVPAPVGQFPGLVNPVVGPSASAPVQAPVARPPAFIPPAVQMPVPQTIAAPTPAAIPAPAAPVVNPQVTAVANNVLARFGINK